MKMRHPNAKGTIEVADEVADRYASQGWVEVKSSPKKSDA